MRRHKLTKKMSKGIFSNSADNIHPKNLAAVPMRGGFRL